MAHSTKPKLYNSVSTKLALAVVLSISAIVGILMVMQSATLGKLTTDSMRVHAESNAQTMAGVLPPPVAFKKTDHIVALLSEHANAADKEFTSYVVLDAEGAILARQGPAADTALADFARSAMNATTPVFSEEQRLIAHPLTFGEDRTVGSFALRWSTEAMNGYIAERQRNALIVSLITGLIAVFATLFAFRRIVLKPMKALTSTLHALRKGEFDTSISSTSRQDEFGTMGRSMEELRGHLAAAAEGAHDASFKREAFESSSAALVLADEVGNIFAANPAFETLCQTHLKQFRNRFSDFDSASLVGKPLTYFHSASDSMMAKLESRSGEVFSTTIAMDDIRIKLNINMIHDENGQKIGYVLEWQDITQAWKNTSLIKAINASQLRAEFSLDGSVSDENEFFRSVLGVSTQEGQCVSLADLMSDQAEDLLARLKKEKSFFGKLSLRTAQGNDVIIEGSITTILDTNGAPYRYFLLGRDVTESELAAEQARWERAELDQERSHVVDALRIAFKRLRDGDLCANLPEPFAERYEELRKDYNDAVDQLNQALGAISDRAKTIRSESQDINGTVDVLSRRTEETAATLEQAAAALDELTSAVRDTADGAQKANINVNDAKASAEQSGKVVLKTVTAMDEISTSSKKVASIIKVIDDIAFQTNLLALNAGVEAARAGEAGRGFAVVASEVRALAQRSSEAASEINSLIAQSVAQVKIGVDLVGETGESLNRIVSSVNDISEQVSEIAGSARQQSLNLEEINSSVSKLDQSTQQNAARLEETTAASDALKREAEAQVDTINHFQTSENVVVFNSRQAQPAVTRPAASAHPVSNGKQATASTAVGSTANVWTDF